MKSLAAPDENADVDLDLALSIGGTFRNLPDKSTASGSSFPLLFTDGDEEEEGEEESSGVTDAKNRGQIGRREPKRKRDEEDERNPPLKREKKLLQGVGSECNVDRQDCRNKPAVQIPYPYSSLQYVPFPNGYAFPFVVPYWAAGAAAVVGHGGERTVHQPVACQGFRPFETNRSGSSQLEQSGSKNRKTGSGGSSPVCSSSVISDNYQSSSSHEGGGSSYTKSNSCNSSSDRHRMLCPNPNPNPNDSMNHDHVKPRPCNENRINKEPIMASNKDEVVEPSSKSVFNSPRSPSMSMKNMKMENGKPTKPQIQSRNVPSLQQMPCVTTTGAGPNGKTITGFLYRYSNLEVSILCVCHGESFSPAEFVKHAGGGDISHPLRHITVLPTNGIIPSAIR